MARGLNKVMIIGNLGQDPEVRFMPSGDPVANINVATTESWTDKQSGQKKEKTEWHRCNAFGKLAEIMQQYLRKGSKVYIEGSLSTRKWTDQQGVDRYSTEIKVRDMEMLDSPNQGVQQQGGGYGQPPAQNQQGGQQQGGQGRQQPPPQQQPGGHGTGPEGYQNHQAAHAHRQSNTPDPGSFDDFDDEIPF